MKYIIKAVLLVSISTFASFNSYAGDYSRHSGLSINLGNHHNGISLSYKSPIKHRYSNHHYDNHDAYKVKHHYKHKRDHSKKQYKKYRKILFLAITNLIDMKINEIIIITNPSINNIITTKENQLITSNTIASTKGHATL
ncbi:MAG: hypothetical protein HN475_01770 [Piscirickettsiaceae bacterium]|nr:hypothetical protein [Piscirickettsiaceae bacterium]